MTNTTGKTPEPAARVNPIATLFPGYFALVMATGIIAIAAKQHKINWLADGLYVMNERIHLVHPDGRDLREDPARLMKLYWHSHRLGLEVGVEAARAVEEALDLVDDDVTVHELICSRG